VKPPPKRVWVVAGYSGDPCAVKPSLSSARRYACAGDTIHAYVLAPVKPARAAVAAGTRKRRKS